MKITPLMILSLKNLTLFLASFLLGIALDPVLGNASTVPNDDSIGKIEKMKEDTIKFRKYLDLADTLSYSNDDSAGIYFVKAYKLVRKLKYDKGLLDLIILYRRWFLRRGDYKNMLKLDLESLVISKKLKNENLIAGKYINLGQVNEFMGNFDQSAKYYLSALKIAEKINNRHLQEISCNNLANIFMVLEEPDKALLYAEKSYELAIDSKKTRSITNTVNILGNAYLINKNYKKAEEYYNKLLIYADSLKKEDYKSGASAVFNAYLNLSEVFNRQSKLDKALETLKKAEIALKEVPYPDSKLYLSINMADVHYKKNEFRIADKYVLQSIALAQEIEAPNELRLVYKLGSEINEHINLQEALDYRKKYEILNDSIMNIEKQNNIQRLEVEYQTERKEKEIAQHQLALARKEVQIKNKNYIITIVVSILILLSLVLVVIYLFYKSKQKAILEKLALLEKEKELQVMEALIKGEEKERSRLAKDLHDGVGGLLSATKMHLSILRNEQTISPNIERFDNTISILDSATREIRTIAHNLAPEILSNYGLDTALDLFCESISNQNLKVNYQCVGNIPRLKNNAELIVYRIGQELINNIIKHAEATEAYVQLSHQDNFMSLSVEDNGKGMNELDKKGIGIISLKARVETLNGEFTTTSAPNEGTAFYIEFDTRMLQAIHKNEKYEAMAS